MLTDIRALADHFLIVLPNINSSYLGNYLVEVVDSILDFVEHAIST